MEIINLFIADFPEVDKHDLIVHLDTGDIKGIVEAINKLGFSVDLKQRPIEDPCKKQKKP